jgi:hypothetical protein
MVLKCGVLLIANNTPHFNTIFILYYGYKKLKYLEKQNESKLTKQIFVLILQLFKCQYQSQTQM